MSSSSSRHQTGSSLSCDVSSSSGGPTSQSSPSLPSKVYDCSGRVVLVQEMLQAGVTEIRGGDGRLAYCFFQVLQTSPWFFRLHMPVARFRLRIVLPCPARRSVWARRCGVTPGCWTRPPRSRTWCPPSGGTGARWSAPRWSGSRACRTWQTCRFVSHE